MKSKILLCLIFLVLSLPSLAKDNTYVLKYVVSKSMFGAYDTFISKHKTLKSCKDKLPKYRKKIKDKKFKNTIVKCVGIGKSKPKTKNSKGEANVRPSKDRIPPKQYYTYSWNFGF